MKQEIEMAENQEVATVFSTQLLENWQRVTLGAMQLTHCPTTAERSWLAPLAKMAPPPFIPAPPEKLTGVILALSAALPKQSTDEMRGETMLKVYQRQLRDLTSDELEQAARLCLDELDWFPTIHQIKERALGLLGNRLRTADQICHDKIRLIARNQPRQHFEPPPEKEMTQEEQDQIEKETAEILAGLRSRAKSERSPLAA